MNERVQSSWTVAPHMHGLRADQCLQRRIGRISRARAARIIKAKDFLLDGMPVKLSVRVREGQVATLFRFAPDKHDDVDSFHVRVVYEDKAMLVVDKPFGMSIHPSANCLYKTLTHWLRTNYPGQKINPCHRIDKETSGLVVCAKERAMESTLKQLFMRGHIKKSYLAVVEGKLEKSQLIAKPLGLQGSRGLVAIRMIEDTNGKQSLTKIRPILYCENVNRSLVLCKPYTGRQHQIRAHLSLIGHGIVGDKLYTHGDDFFDAWCNRVLNDSDLVHPRHALHARSLQFRLGDKMYCFKSDMPEDFYDLIPVM